MTTKKAAHRIPGQPANGRYLGAQSRGWDILVDVTCVECPDCGFVMDYDHVDAEAGDRYTCPNCTESTR